MVVDSTRMLIRLLMCGKPAQKSPCSVQSSGLSLGGHPSLPGSLSMCGRLTSPCPLPWLPQYVQQANKPGRGYYIQEEMDRIKMENDRRKLEELLRCECVWGGTYHEGEMLVERVRGGATAMFVWSTMRELAAMTAISRYGVLVQYGFTWWCCAGVLL